jgi:arylsulfatase A-like enzyme
MCPTDKDLPVPVIPQRLADLGYQTAGFGKTHWYLGSRIDTGKESRPSRRGFQVKAQARPADPAIVQPDAVVMEKDDPEAWSRLQAETIAFGDGGENILGYLGCTSAVPGERHLEGWLTRHALDFLERGRSTAAPLFLYLSFDFPHPGFNVPKGYEDLYNLDLIPERSVPPWKAYPQGHVREDWRAKEWGRKTSNERRLTTLRYYALCSFIDDMFGAVLTKLRQIGELDNTVVLFCSDHGEMLGDRRHHFGKYCLYEGSVRVPLIIAGPTVPLHKQGTVDDRPAELVDVLPTLLDVAAGSIDPRLPGKSLLAPPCRRGAFSELHGTGYESIQQLPAYMWRTKEWKLILYQLGNITDAMLHNDDIGGELYDLRNDPHEWTNLYEADQFRRVRETLTHQLLMQLAIAWGKYPHQAAHATI